MIGRRRECIFEWKNFGQWTCSTVISQIVFEIFLQLLNNHKPFFEWEVFGLSSRFPKNFYNFYFLTIKTFLSYLFVFFYCQSCHAKNIFLNCVFWRYAKNKSDALTVFVIYRIFQELGLRDVSFFSVGLPTCLRA